MTRAELRNTWTLHTIYYISNTVSVQVFLNSAFVKEQLVFSYSFKVWICRISYFSLFTHSVGNHWRASWNYSNIGKYNHWQGLRLFWCKISWSDILNNTIKFNNNIIIQIYNNIIFFYTYVYKKLYGCQLSFKQCTI